jgi:Na+/melibiose symporter-like transporter
MDDRLSSAQQPWWLGKAHRQHNLLKVIIFALSSRCFSSARLPYCSASTTITSRITTRMPVDDRARANAGILYR